jgi:1-acyl-sn-glycerol-3-phosphate acyltransferase
LTFSGDVDVIQSGENAFILCNHQSWTDFYPIHALAQKKEMLSRCRYFAKNTLKYIPILGYDDPLPICLSFKLVNQQGGL